MSREGPNVGAFFFCENEDFTDAVATALKQDGLSYVSGKTFRRSLRQH
jgi:hypothetical protein